MQLRLNPRPCLAGIVTVSLLIGGCDDNATNGNQPQPTLTSLWEAKFSGCALSCHEPDGVVPFGPDLSTKAQFRDNTVDKSIAVDYPNWLISNGGNYGGDCANIPFIKPGDPSASTVLASLVQTYADELITSGACTTTSYNTHLVNQVAIIDDPDLEQAIVDWIAAGAPDN